jgi:hypothetical protein
VPLQQPFGELHRSNTPANTSPTSFDHGRVIDTAGDGILTEFPSVFNAVKCGIAIQEVMRERNSSLAPECAGGADT